MTLQERIGKLDDFSLLNFYNFFTASLIAQLSTDLPTIVDRIPESIRAISEVDRVIQADPGVMGEPIAKQEAVTFARQTLLFWANDPQLSPVLDDLLSNYRDNTANAGVLLELGGAVSMILLMSTSSVKRDKDGKWEFNILGLSAEEIEERRKLIIALLKAFPEAVAKYFPFF